MHSYLIAGYDEEKIQDKIDKLVAKISGVTHEFKVGKIEEVRNLNSYLKLKVSAPTVIVIRNIENATSEALNAFLKSLEEPQENLSFILTTSSTYKVLPTIVSRCQIVRTASSNLPAGKTGQQLAISKEVQKFLGMSIAGKLRYVDAIRGKDSATSFAEQIILYTHQLLYKKDSNYRVLSTILRNSHSTLAALTANGNVSLQLTNFIVNFPL